MNKILTKLPIFPKPIYSQLLALWTVCRPVAVPAGYFFPAPGVDVSGQGPQLPAPPRGNHQKLDRDWLYSPAYSVRDTIAMPNELPGSYRYAVALAVEMDYEAIRCSPTGPASAATGLGYSKMAFAAGLLAHHIRGLGFKAMACGNDTACSIPIAIDAGLGELARNGLLVTPEFGPRVRLAKVLTDLPL